MSDKANSNAPVYVVGDVHGERAKVVGLLQKAGLIDEAEQWSGNDARLWFTGDFFDRGPDGTGALELVMRLQQEAAATGGEVGALLGNHEFLVLGSKRFGGEFVYWWRRNGGQPDDLARLTERHLEWLRNLPAMAMVNDRLLIHADALFYLNYGKTVDEVNQAFRMVLHSDEADGLELLLEQSSERMMFLKTSGAAEAARMLKLFGGQQIIHGHTPIPHLRRVAPELVTEPLVYAGGRCVNVDGGMMMGGPGFVYRLPPLDPALAKAG